MISPLTGSACESCCWTLWTRYGVKSWGKTSYGSLLFCEGLQAGSPGEHETLILPPGETPYKGKL